MTRTQAVRGVAGAAALIAVLTVLARLAGFGRTLVFTNAVGAGSTGDTYLAANNVPNIVFEVVARLLLGSSDPVQVDLAARFLVVFAPQVVLYGIGIVLTGVLQAHRRFAGPALAPLLSSLVVAGAYLVFAGIGGDPDAADLSTPAELVLGVGTTLGVVALTLSLLAPVRGLRLALRPTLRFPVGAAPR